MPVWPMINPALFPKKPVFCAFTYLAPAPPGIPKQLKKVLEVFDRLKMKVRQDVTAQVGIA